MHLLGSEARAGLVGRSGSPQATEVQPRSYLPVQTPTCTHRPGFPDGDSGNDNPSERMAGTRSICRGRKPSIPTAQEPWCHHTPASFPVPGVDERTARHTSQVMIPKCIIGTENSGVYELCSFRQSPFQGELTPESVPRSARRQAPKVPARCRAGTPCCPCTAAGALGAGRTFQGQAHSSSSRCGNLGGESGAWESTRTRTSNL